MSKPHRIFRKGLSRRRTVVLGVLGLLIAIALVAAACGGDDDTPTPRPATATPRPQPTATLAPGADTPTPRPPTATPEVMEATATPVIVPTATPLPGVATATPRPTATPRVGGLRDIADWTCDEPGTRAEIEAELENHRGEEFTFVGWGGTYQDSQRFAWFDPLLENWGIIINEVSPMSLGAVGAQGQVGGLPVWNVGASSGGSVTTMYRQGAIEDLDCAIVDIRSWPEHLQKPWFGGGAISWGWVWAYSTESYPDGGPQPQTMADVFNLDKFPGNRGIWSIGGWKQNLRWSLLAADPTLLDTDEGKASLLRLEQDEIERGYEILEEFRPDIHTLYGGYTDCPQFLVSGEVDMCIYDTGMAYDAYKDNLPVNVCWSCGIISQTDQMFVIKETSLDPELFELVNLALGWMSLPEIHPLSSQYVGYGPVNLDSFQYIEGDPRFAVTQQFLPTSPQNFPYAVFTDEIYDGDIGVEQLERWDKWLAGIPLGLD